MDWQDTVHWVYVASGALYFIGLSKNPRGRILEINENATAWSRNQAQT